MANFVANVPWDINNIDTSLYTTDNIVNFGDEQNGNFSFNSQTYPDRFFVEGQNGGAHRTLFAYGSYTVNFLGLPSGGTFNAFQEFDNNTASTNWLLDGVSIPASSVTSAATNGTFAALLQSALGGNDTIDLSSSNDVMDGYSGTDTVILTSSFAASSVSLDGSVLVVTTPTDGTDRLSNVEFLNFSGDVRSVASIFAPVPVAANTNATEDGAVVNGQLSATDPQGDSVTFALIGSVPGLTINPNGSYSFNPANAAYQSLKQGQVSNVVANFSATDGVYSASSTLTIAVTGVNDAPVFNPNSQALAVNANTATPFGAFATDIDGDTLSYSSDDPVHGTVTGGAGGNFTYTPDNGYSGSDTITITVSDGNGGSAIKTHNVTVTVPNIAPAFPVESANANTPEDTVLNGALPVATDANGNPLTYSLSSGAAHGNVVVNANGTYSYTPATNYNGPDSFVGLVSDGLGGTDTVTINVTVNPVNDAPVFPVDSVNAFTALNAGLNGALPVATDVDGNALTYSLLTQSVNGTAVVNANGTFSFTPSAGFTGNTSFTGRVSDGNGGTDTVVVNVTVFGSQTNVSIDVPPSGEPVVFDAGTGTFAFTDNVNVRTDVRIVNLGPDDVIRVTGIASRDVYSYTSNADSVIVSFSNGVNFTQINIDPVGNLVPGFVFDFAGAEAALAHPNFLVLETANTAPAFPVDAVTRTTVQNNAVVGTLPVATDIDGNALTYSLLTGPANGAAAVNANGAWSFTPNAGFTGNTSFVAQVSDGNGGTDTVTVNLTVNAPPPAADQWSMLTSTGFAGSIGGTGKVFGATGFQDIAVLDVAGTVILDGSFNQSGDIVRLPGNAADWQIKRVGSAALFSDGDTFVQIPAGTTGMTVVFADGVRLLRIDTGAGTLKIGAQAFNETYVQITAAADGSVLPTGANASASAKILLVPDGDVAAAGKLSIFGTGAGDETVHLLSGDATLDASFNQGGDTLVLDPAATAFMASQIGSQAFLDGAATDVRVPAGTTGMTIAFGGGADPRLLLIDTNIPAIVVDGQQIGLVPVALIA